MSEMFEEEKVRLDKTKQKIEKEIEFHEKEMKEIPKRHTNVLQGDAFLVESLMSVVATKLRKLEMAKEKPYFGRIDFTFADNGTNDKIYIGKTNVTDENHNLIVTDWRAPICSLYYDTDLGEAEYAAPAGVIKGNLDLKRQIVIRDGVLENVYDLSFGSNDELLLPYLSGKADNRMKTIIASIQKEQNKIIRKPITQNIIVQGVAGSGKTSVALHRIAFLIYDMQEEINSNHFLVIGPNNCFLNYVSSILPELETEPVIQQTYFDMIAEILDEKLALNNQNFDFEDAKDTEIIRKIQQYKSSLVFKADIDKFMNDYFEKMVVPFPLTVDDEVIFTKEEIKRMLFSTKDKYPNFNIAINYFSNKFKNNIEEIYDKVIKKYRDVYMSLPMGDPVRAQAVKDAGEIRNLIKNKGVKIVKDYFKKINLSALSLYKLFISKIEDYTDIKDEKTLEIIKKSTLANINKRKVEFEDMPALLHINNMTNSKRKRYKHVVIDEAQDYGLFHFDAIKEYFAESTFSIYGDLGQSIYLHRSIKNWESVASKIFNDECELLNLNKSYRTTMEITKEANKILKSIDLKEAEPVVRRGMEPVFSDKLKEPEYKMNKIKEWQNKGYKTIAIICKTDKEAKQTFEQLRSEGVDLKNITDKDSTYDGGVFVVTAALAKGLEFDAVMVNDASAKKYSSSSYSDMRLLYVACTRALHELEVLYKDDLCDVFGKTQTKVISTHKR